MSRLNRDAALVARRAGARAATDVTGFGLAGHLHKMMVASAAAAVLHWADLPLLDGVTRSCPSFSREALDETWAGWGMRCTWRAPPGRPVPGGYRLGDPQTSGGLLVPVAVGPGGGDGGRTGVASGHRAAVIGGVVEAGALEAEGGAVAGSVRVLDG